MRTVTKSVGVLVLGLMAASAFAADGPTPPPKVISKAHQPVGTPHKASSYAPHRTGKRVFGDPIQAPIVHNAPAPKKSPPN